VTRRALPDAAPVCGWRWDRLNERCARTASSRIVADVSGKSETQEFFEKFRLLEAHRHEIDRAQLLAALGVALEKAGHVRLVSATSDEQPSADIAGLLVPVLFWGLGASVGIVLGWAWPLWIALAVGIAVVYGVIAAAAPKVGRVAALLLVVAWIGVGITLSMTEPSRLVWSYGLPIAAAVVMAILLRTLRLREARDVAVALAAVGRAAPYLVPVVMIAVLLPALTADVWRLAAATTYRNLAGAALSRPGSDGGWFSWFPC
jgi:hypothetical protein